MTKNGKIIGMIAIGIILLTFLGAIVGIMNRDGGFVNPVPANTSQVVPKANNDAKSAAVSEEKIPQATSDVGSAADAILLEAEGEKNEAASEISESADVFGSQEISDLAETYEENDF